MIEEQLCASQDDDHKKMPLQLNLVKAKKNRHLDTLQTQMFKYPTEFCLLLIYSSFLYVGLFFCSLSDTAGLPPTSLEISMERKESFNFFGLLVLFFIIPVEVSSFTHHS